MEIYIPNRVWTLLL